MDNAQFYENHDWSTIDNKSISLKIKHILAFSPKDVNSIIDIGCGNGIITNALQETFDVTGVDRSHKALENLKTKKILASAESIPVDDNSFEIVLSSELLEHLEDEIFYKAIDEMKRISKKYILLSVPNRENLDKNLIQCTKCKFIYNRSSHFRSFSKSQLENHFSEYDLLKFAELGAPIRHYNRILSKIKCKVSPPKSWIPYYLMPKEKRKTFCPNCEHKFSYPYKFNILAFACDMLNIIISPKRPYWQMVLLKKKVSNN